MADHGDHSISSSTISEHEKAQRGLCVCVWVRSADRGNKDKQDRSIELYGHGASLRNETAPTPSKVLSGWRILVVRKCTWSRVAGRGEFAATQSGGRVPIGRAGAPTSSAFPCEGRLPLQSRPERGRVRQECQSLWPAPKPRQVRGG